MLSRARTGVVCLAVVLSSAPGARAFHDGRVGACEGCHEYAGRAAGPFLLRGRDASSTCLRCHDVSAARTPRSVIVSGADAPSAHGLTAGGDFAWLKVDRPGDPGWGHGHNVVAADFGYAADPRRPVAPGGTFPSAELGCTSCHDPHATSRVPSPSAEATSAGPQAVASGSSADRPLPTPERPVGVYRLLWTGATTHRPRKAAFTVTPVAVESDGAPGSLRPARVAYGAGWGTWCRACHGDRDALRHAAHRADGVPSRSIVQRQAAVRGAVVLARQTRDSSALATWLATGTYPAAEPPTEELTCLSCHRAHASEYRAGLRAEPGPLCAACHETAPRVTAGLRAVPERTDTFGRASEF